MATTSPVVAAESLRGGKSGARSVRASYRVRGRGGPPCWAAVVVLASVPDVGGGGGAPGDREPPGDWAAPAEEHNLGGVGGLAARVPPDTGEEGRRGEEALAPQGWPTWAATAAARLHARTHGEGRRQRI